MKLSFAKNTHGNITLVFAFMAATVVTGAGVALDYAMAVNVKTKMQNALDAAATAVCTSPGSDPDEVIRTRLTGSVSEFGLELLPAPEPGQPQSIPTGGQAVVIDTMFNPSSGSLMPSLSTNRPTTIMGIAGVNEVPITVETEVSCASKRLELSLMLDASGSMADTVNGVVKLDSLKEAARDVLDIFELGMSTGKTRIALVPFSHAVNVGTFAQAARGTIGTGMQTTPGSNEFSFTNWDNNNEVWQISNCVSERNGANAYTDAPPTTEYFGLVYRSGGQCLNSNSSLVPLTSDANTLETAINGYSPDGYTAGHIATGWAWYTISENWASFWPAGSKPEAPNEDELIKATILMTDGKYNTQYCDGVEDRTINCIASNGSSQDQAAALCQAMKDQGIVVYTVGFDIASETSQETLLKQCASDDTKWFFPYNGDELRTAFQSIGHSLAKAQFGYPIVQR